MGKKSSPAGSRTGSSKAPMPSPVVSNVEDRLAAARVENASQLATVASQQAMLRRMRWLKLLLEESAADSRNWLPKAREKRAAFLAGLMRAGSDSDSDEISKLMAIKAREVLVETVERAAWLPEGPAYYVVAPLPKTDEAPDALLGVTHGLKWLAVALTFLSRQTPSTLDPVTASRIIESIGMVRDDLRDLAARIPADLRERINGMLGDALEAVGRGVTAESQRLAGELAERFRGMAVRVQAEASEPLDEMKNPAGRSEPVAAAEIPAVAGGSTLRSKLKLRKVPVNARMLDAMTKNHECHSWSAREWATYLGCSKSTVHSTNAWKSLMTMRENAKLERVQRQGRRTNCK